MSEYIKDDYLTISTLWSWHDLVDAHIVLDAIDEFAALNHIEAEARK